MRGMLGSLLIGVCALSGSAWGQGDPEAIGRIVEEGRNNSHVWTYLSHLCEEIGPRVTGSTRMMRANAWTRDTFASFGMTGVHLQKVGEIPVRFDRGPCWARMEEPVGRPFEFTAMAWSAGTNGPLRGRVVKAPPTMEALEAIQDELAGSWVLSKEQTRRRRRRPRPENENNEDVRELRRQLDEALRQAGIAGRIVGSRSEGVRTDGIRGWSDLDYRDLPEDVTIFVRRSDYDAMNSRVADGEEVIVAADLKHHFAEGPFALFNTIADIPGTEWPEQMVIFSAHLDSWDGPGSQGAQDNGTGCAVVLEAARILTAAGVQPRRTIRFILWVGEEQGFLGSGGYLERLSEEQRANLSAVFVEDGGTGYQSGLSCIESMAPMLRQATAPVAEAFPDMPVEIRLRERLRGGGSDHAPFIRAGIPGFFWGEGGSEDRQGMSYGSIHHNQNDRIEHAVEEYLLQSATCSAITLYNLAMADTLLPREVRQEPEPLEEVDEENWTSVPGPLSGTWQAKLVDREEGPGRGFTLAFDMSDDGRIRGTLDSEFIGGKLRNIAFDPDAGVLTFVMASEMGRINYKAEVTGDEMSGTISFDSEFTMAFKGTRVKQADEAAEDAPAGEAPAEEAEDEPADDDTGEA